MSITACVITLSDKGSEGLREDLSGPTITEMLTAIDATVTHTEILPDEKALIIKKLIQYTDKVDLIITTGGTGLSPRDVTPEATLEVIERQIPGIPEVMRAAGLPKTHRAMLSRSVCGTRGSTLILNLPGSVKAVRENLEAVIDVLPHAIEKIKGDPSDCGAL
jgi:molybdopterin adenylyltransferase